MPRSLVFSDSFITGVEEMDRQHRNLVDLTNEAAGVFARNPSPNQVRQVVRDLLNYAIYHFQTEESLMQRYGYAEAEGEHADAHVDTHRRFSARIVAAQEALQNRESVDTDELISFLNDWISDHILITDKRLAEFILRERARQPADHNEA